MHPHAHMQPHFGPPSGMGMPPFQGMPPPNMMPPGPNFGPMGKYKQRSLIFIGRMMPPVGSVVHSTQS